MNDTPYITHTVSGTQELAHPQALEPVPLAHGELEAMRSLARPARRKDRPRPERQPSLRHSGSDEKRRRVLQTAKLIWAERGIMSDSIRTLAQEAGVSHTRLYTLMGTREDVLAEIITEHVIAVSARVCAASDATAAARPEERLEAMVTAFLNGVAQEPHAHFLLQHGLCAMTPSGRDLVKLRYGILLELLGKPLMQLAPVPVQGGVLVEDKLATALALAALGAAGDALLWFDPNQELDVAETARRLTLMMLAAVESTEKLGPRAGCGRPTLACAQAWLAGAWLEGDAG